MIWRYTEPYRSDYDSEEEYQEALDAYDRAFCCYEQGLKDRNY